MRSVVALMLREMSTTYGRSPGGYLWAVLEPVGGIMVLTLAFSLLLRAPSLGTDFALFYATGYLPFTVYSKISTAVGASLRFSRALLTYPSVTYVDAILARFLLTLLTQVMVFYVIINGIVIVRDLSPILEFGAIVKAFAMAAMLGLGIGVLNAHLGTMYPVWKNVWGIVTRPLFLASGIFYLPEDLPGWAMDVLIWNPLIHIVGLMRRGFYATYDASYVSPTYVCTVALIAMALGLLLLRRDHKEILFER